MAQIWGPGGPFFEHFDANTRDGILCYDGFEETIASLCKEIRSSGPYDGLLGFSQGGTVAGAVAAMRDGPSAPPELASLRFVVCFSALKARARSLEDLFVGANRRLTTPVLFSWGEQETHYIQGFEALTECFPDRLVVKHKKGHVLPTFDGPEAEAVKAWLGRFQHQSTL